MPHLTAMLQRKPPYGAGLKTMKLYLISILFGLCLSNFQAFTQSQRQSCNVEIVRLEFDKSRDQKSQEITDSLLMLAKSTGSVLVSDNEIKKFDIKTDTACCTYAGAMYITSHRYSLTKQAISRLSGLNIPLCCGIPVAILVGSKEVYRAMLWNVVSSFGNKSLTMILLQDTLVVVSQLPNVPDFRKSILTSKRPLIECLLDR
jgi:hypothetical protein